MNKLHLIFGCFLIFLFQACKSESSKGVNENTQPSQSVLDVDKSGSHSESQDSSTVKMEEHTQLSNEADSAKAEEARGHKNNKR